MSRRDTPALAPRLDALGEAAELAAGRLPEDVVAGADAVVRAAGERQALSAEHTVVGFFGATGSGKSSLFNALTGRDLARVAATRPTTSEPLAAVWGVGRGQGLDPDAEHGDGTGEGGGAAALLDWLGVRRRHLLDEAPVLDDGRPGFLGLGRREGADATGLILLDLPDIDSVERGNREITSRLAGHVDVLVWVVDPEKYADAVLHREFLATMGSHAAVTLVLLNQVDRLSVRDRDVVLASLRRMLSGHGLGDVRVLPVSARTGEGLEEVGRQVAAIVAQRGAAAERLGADVAARAADLAAASRRRPPTSAGGSSSTRCAPRWTASTPSATPSPGPPASRSGGAAGDGARPRGCGGGDRRRPHGVRAAGGGPDRARPRRPGRPLARRHRRPGRRRRPRARAPRRDAHLHGRDGGGHGLPAPLARRSPHPRLRRRLEGRRPEPLGRQRDGRDRVRTRHRPHPAADDAGRLGAVVRRGHRRRGASPRRAGLPGGRGRPGHRRTGPRRGDGARGPAPRRRAVPHAGRGGPGPRARRGRRPRPCPGGAGGSPGRRACGAGVGRGWARPAAH
nr:GTPase [Micrococcus luteus]